MKNQQHLPTPPKKRIASAGESLFMKAKRTIHILVQKVVKQAKSSEEFGALKGRVEHKTVELTSSEFELLANEVHKLEELKSELLQYEGTNALSFADRYLDQPLVRMKGLLALYQREAKQNASPFSTRDIATHLTLIKSGMMIQKIRTEVVECVHKAIYDDLACIASYQESLNQPTEEQKDRISRIVEILLDLTKNPPNGGTIQVLYRWKKMVDWTRQALLDLALEQCEPQPTKLKKNPAIIQHMTSLLRELLSEKGKAALDRLQEQLAEKENERSSADLDDLRKQIGFFLNHLIDQ